MKTRLLLITLFFAFQTYAQTTKDYAVMIQVTTLESPATITLNWNADSTCTSQQLYRKSKTSIDWGIPLITLTSKIKQYVDPTVTIGKTYEYYIRRIYSNRTAHGYVLAGIKVPEMVMKGTMLLLVDQNYVSPLAAEIDQLTTDLIADGWKVKRLDIDRAASVKSVKTMITAAYANDKATKCIYLLGRIPVPYSGAFSTSGSFYPPDGHPDHGGAWPADLYYGTLNEGIWFDDSVNDTTGSRKQNHNVPGDGKFDVVYLYPDTVALQVGRVDLTNMPQFGKSDTLLVKQYLQKAHEFKVGNTATVRRGLIDDNFGAMGGEAFASTAFHDFSVMFGDSVFSNRDYLTATKQGNYLFSYGCGAGSYTSASGIGTTANFNNDSINTTFTAMFGSYFGDWDATNNFLRAPLCNKTTLSNAWSGRPYWMFHPMALGENIGYSARLSQNNYSTFAQSGTAGYAYNTAPTFVHIALMGDPSLRLHAIKPPSGLHASTDVGQIRINLNWQASPDAEYYVVLRSGEYNSQYKIISGRLASTQLTFTDSVPDHGMNHYQVRAVKLEQTPSGTYYNTSLAVSDSASSTNLNGLISLHNQTLNAEVYPNPNHGSFVVGLENTKEEARVDCYDITGKWIATEKTVNGSASFELSENPGVYILRIETKNGSVVKKVVVQ